jgi:predicted RNase H-like nuclease (RuvC/YqgF family)
MDLITIEMLSNCLNISKFVYKNGLTGIIILGDHRQKIFTALPEHFTHTDYDVHIVSGAEIAKDIETIKTIVPQLIQVGALDPEILIDSLTAKSLTEMKMKIRSGLKAKKKENDILKQLQEQNAQLQEQLKQASAEIEQLNTEVESNTKAQVELQKEKLKLENEVD